MDAQRVAAHNQGMGTRLLNDAQHWRDRAEESRTLASEMTDAQTKATMLKIAEGYETMAAHADARLAKPSLSHGNQTP